MSSLLFPVAKHYIAGKYSSDITQVAKLLNSAGYRIIANYLGEDIEKEEEISLAVNQYIDLIEVLDQNMISGSISVKLTQLGLSVSDSIATENLSRIIDIAKARHRYVWIDMEGSNYTDKTIEIYSNALSSYKSIGIAIQAYLKRSQNDIEKLSKISGQIRLVKGAYHENPEILVGGRKETRENFARLLKILFSKDNFFAVATHDEKLIKLTQDFAKETRNENFEFQFLKGVREDRAAQLLSAGFKVSIYVPYGENWLPYALRRIKERRRNILYFVKGALGI
ncbi:MAG: proline dehydrogenase family protein [Conexivisphaerales archaeon]